MPRRPDPGVAEKSVAESLDVYHRWLGIPPKDQPPNHYRLLALEPFESDPDVIEAAADRQMGHLRTYQTGTHADLSQRLLNEVAAAKVCLFNPQKKAEYDLRLRLQIAARAQSVQAPGGAAIDPDVAGLIERTDLQAPGKLPHPIGESPRPNAGVVVGVLAAVTAVLLLLAAAVMWPKGPGEPSGDGRVAAAGAAGASDAGPKHPEEPRTEKSPIAEPASDKPKSAEPKPAEPDPAEPKSREPKSAEPKPPQPEQGEAPSGPGLGKEPPKPDEPPPGEVWRVGKEPAGPPSRQPNVPVEKAPVPSEAEQEKARKLVLEVYQKQYDRATDPEDQLALARKLLAGVQEGENEPAERFVLLVMARELAERGRNWPAAAEAIDELAAGFRVDAVGMKAQVLEDFAKVARMPPDHGAIAEAALPLVEEAAAQEDFALAGRLAKLAQGEAGKSRNRELQIAARASQKRVQEMARAFAGVEAARAVLKDAPKDPDANRVVGRYLCFVRGDWAGGLPRLASSSDETLKAVAQKDLAAPASPAEMVALGNQWWDLGEKEDSEGQKPLRLRSAHWYRAAIDELPQGLERDRVQERLQKIAPLEAAAGRGREAKKGPYRAYEGTWIVVIAAPGSGRRYVIEAGGDVSWGPLRGRLTRRNGDLLIDFGDGALDRVKLAGEGLVVEHFGLAGRYPNQPTWEGKARRLQKDPTETAARLFRSLQGFWLIQYANKTARAYAIDAKGNVLGQTLDAKGNVVPQTNKQGRLTVRDGEIVLDFQDGTVERIERYGPGLWVEHFNPATAYPHTILLFGLGVRK